eukprot:482332-Amphidinium_carterae.1
MVPAFVHVRAKYLLHVTKKRPRNRLQGGLCLPVLTCEGVSRSNWKRAPTTPAVAGDKKTAAERTAAQNAC